MFDLSLPIILNWQALSCSLKLLNRKSDHSITKRLLISVKTQELIVYKTIDETKKEKL